MFANVMTSEFNNRVDPIRLRGTASTLDGLMASSDYSPTPIQYAPFSSLTKQDCPPRKVTNSMTGDQYDCYAVEL